MPPVYTKRELAQEAGIHPRMIKDYRKMGLLGPPYKRQFVNAQGEYPVWGPEHLAALRKINDIRSNNRTLADIADMLNPEDDD